MMRRLIKACPDEGVLLVRLALAAVFIAHGWAKFANAEGGIAFFSSLGLSEPVFYFVAAVEFVGGLAMLLGILTEYVGYALAIDMAVAIYLVRWQRGLVGGYEFELTLLLIALAVACLGPGKYSLEQMVKQRS